MYGSCIDDGSSCASCIMNDNGDCVDPEGSTDCSMNNCLANEVGNCVEGGPGQATTSGVLGWLIPPGRTTAFGFWATLGCASAGQIMIEFDVVNDDMAGATGRQDVQGISIPGSAATGHADNAAAAVRPWRTKAAAHGRSGGSSAFANPTSARRMSRRLLLNARSGGQAAYEDAASAAGAAAALTTPRQSHDWIGRLDDPCYGGTQAANIAAGDATVFASRTITVISSAVTSSTPSASSTVASNPTNAVRVTGKVAGHRRRLLSTSQDQEDDAVRCPYYSRSLQVDQTVLACSADQQQLVGVWFGGYVKNGWIRQIRLQTTVDNGNSDPSLYLVGIVVSQTVV